MKIENLKINGYANLKNTEINFGDGINIIYGKNEQGKSTLLNYILNSFYGISKNKNKKEISDYKKFTPWVGEDFSGTLEYKLDNNKKYKIFRDFKKKKPKLYNENMEDVISDFNMDKTKGSEFFYEQTNVDEELFKSTFLVEQQSVKLDNANQQMLVQKISNIIGTGEDNVSYNSAMDKLKKKLLNEVGTKNSREKPINLLSRKIEEVNNELTELKNYENLKYEIDDKKSRIKNEIDLLEKKNKIANEYKNEKQKISEKYFLENEKIKLQENIQNENESKLFDLKSQEENIKNEELKILEKNSKVKNKISKLNKKIFFIFLLIILLNVLQFIFIKNRLINFIFLLTLPTVLIFYYFSKKNLKNKFENEKVAELKSKKNNLQSEKKLLEENANKLKEEIKKIKEKNNLENNLENENLKNKYKNSEIKDLIDSENLDEELSHIQNSLSGKKLQLHQYDLDKENIEPQLDNLSNLNETLENYREQYVNLMNKAQTIECAKEALSSAYEKMKSEVTPKLTNNLSNNISAITNGKYKKAMYNENDGLIVETENGKNVAANKLSIGTIDQLYLSLRLSMVDDLSSETLPIFLDESFAYFDNDRLKNILNYLYNQFKNRQIIIFTCSHREKQTLENENIPFKFIEL